MEKDYSEEETMLLYYKNIQILTMSLYDRTPIFSKHIFKLAVIIIQKKVYIVYKIFSTLLIQVCMYETTEYILYGPLKPHYLWKESWLSSGRYCHTGPVTLSVNFDGSSW